MGDFRPNYPFARNELQDRILTAIVRMKVGEAITFSGHIVLDAFRMHNLFEERPPEDQILEKLMGSNYGTFRVRYDPFKMTYTVSRHEPGEERVREDWDRRFR